MGDAISGVADKVGSGLGSVGNAIGSGVNWLGDEVGKGAGAIGNLFTGGGHGSTGQPSSGTPGAIPAALAQSTPSLSSATSAASPAGASSFAGGLPNFGGDDPVSQAVARMNTSDLSVLTDPSSLNPGHIPLDLMSSLGGGGAPAASGGGFSLSKLLGKEALPAAALGYSIYKGNKTPSQVKSLQALADQQNQAGTALQAGAIAEQQGKLPGGAEAAVNNSVEAMKARIRQNYAQLGLTGSTAEAQDLAYADQAAEMEKFQIGQGMAQTGFQAASQDLGVASGLYGDILNAETAQGTALGDALAEFAGGLVDFGRKV